jgi:hypothetical protein
MAQPMPRAHRLTCYLLPWYSAMPHASRPHPSQGRDELVAMTCPSLAGMYLVKLAMMLTLIGGVSHPSHLKQWHNTIAHASRPPLTGPG